MPKTKQPDAKPLPKGKMKDETHDYSAFKAPPKGHILGQLRKCAQDILKEEAEVARLHDLLETAQARLTHMNETVMPALMDKAESSDWTSADGINVAIEEQFFSHISEEHKPKAHKWLEANKLGDYIKRQFIISFGRNEEAWAKKLSQDLKKRKKPLNFQVKEAVHAKSLNTMVKNILTEGELKLPLDLFGVHRRKVAKVTVPK
jgi:hypothetical protein